MKKTILATAAVATIGLAGLAGAAPANALACGTPALVINGPADPNNALWYYGATGTLLETVPMGASSGYGDIALSQDAKTVYGVNNDSAPLGDTVDLVDAATGVVKGSLTITGPAAGIGGWVGAAIRPDGKLIIGSGNDSKVFTVDTTTGASTLFFDLSTLPDGGSGANTTGDFATLPNGDEVALATLDNGSNTDYYLVRIDSNGSGIEVGTIPEAWGAGRVLDDVQFAQADGIISKIAIADIPTVAGTAPLNLATVVDTGNSGGLWGAAGTQDSGDQKCALPDTGFNGSQALSAGLLAAGLGLAGAAGIVVARRRKRA